MRGKQFNTLRKTVTDGITPADAGKTVPVFGHRAHNRDHPRGCGENREELVRQPLKYGSPPRMRGKPAPATEKQKNMRITPADAGKTMMWRRIFRGE